MERQNQYRYLNPYAFTEEYLLATSPPTISGYAPNMQITVSDHIPVSDVSAMGNTNNTGDTTHH